MFSYSVSILSFRKLNFHNETVMTNETFHNKKLIKLGFFFYLLMLRLLIESSLVGRKRSGGLILCPLLHTGLSRSALVIHRRAGQLPLPENLGALCSSRQSTISSWEYSARRSVTATCPTAASWTTCTHCRASHFSMRALYEYNLIQRS